MISSEARDVRHGVLLHLSAVLSDGQQVKSAWKAHQPPGHADECLRWELRRIVPACGFLKKTNRGLWRVLADNWAKWQGLLLSVGLQHDLHMGRSRHALMLSKTIPEEALLDAEQESWISTTGLLCILVLWPATRRSLHDKEQVKCVSKAFLSEVLLPEQACHHAAWAVPEACSHHCQQGVVIDGLCECLQQARIWCESASAEDTCPQRLVWNRLDALANVVYCPAAKALLREVAEQLATCIAESAPCWGDFDWHRSQHAIMHGPSKKRRVDFHVKQYVVTDALQSAKHKTSMQAVGALSHTSKSSGCKWKSAEMSAYRASSQLTFRSGLTLSIAVDATRLGRPARHVLAGVVSCSSLDRHAVLPPQVL